MLLVIKFITFVQIKDYNKFVAYERNETRKAITA